VQPWVASDISALGALAAVRMSRMAPLTLAAWPRQGALTISIASRIFRKSAALIACRKIYHA